MQKSAKENVPPECARKGKLPVPNISDVKRKRHNDSTLSDIARPAKSPKSCGRVYKGSLDGDERRQSTAGRILAGKAHNKSQTPGPPLRLINKDIQSSKYCTPIKRTSIYAPSSQKLGNDLLKQLCQELTSSDHTPKRSNRPIPDLTPKRVLKSQLLSSTERTKQSNDVPTQRCVTKPQLVHDADQEIPNNVFTPHRVVKSQLSDNSGVTGTGGKTEVFTPQRVIKSKLADISDITTPQRVIKSKLSDISSASRIISNLNVATPQRVIKSKLSDISGASRVIRNSDVHVLTPQRVIKSKLSAISGTGETFLNTDALTPQRVVKSKISNISGPGQTIPNNDLLTLQHVKSQLLEDQKKFPRKDSKVETSRNQGKLTGLKIDGYYSDEYNRPCQVTGLKEDTPAEQSTYPAAPDSNTPEMQLPVVINPVETSDCVTEMPNPISTDWSKAETGTSSGENVIFDEKCTTDGAEIQGLINPSKSYDMPTANQNLLDRIQQRLERKLKGFGESKPKDTNQLRKELKETADNLNSKNNNVVVSEDNCTYESLETAGQSNRNLSQGIQNDTNANDITSCDIYSNLDTANVAKSIILEESLSNSTDHKLDTNITYDMSYMQDSRVKQAETITKPHCHIEIPLQLRNMDMSDKVVCPNNDNYDVNVEHFGSYQSGKQIEAYGMEHDQIAALTSEHDGMIEADDTSGVNLYAPTPVVERRSGTLFSPKGREINSNFPLMTPLALKMVAKQQLRSDSPKRLTEDHAHIPLDETVTHGSEVKQKPEVESFSEISLEETYQAEAGSEGSASDVLLKTPPPKKSAFYAVQKSSLSPLVGSLSLRGNSIGKIKRSKITARSKEKCPKLLYMSMHERYQDAVLDDEVTRFASRLVAEHTGYYPRGCSNPLAKILMEGDDMHFVPITEEKMDVTCSPTIQGSAFTKYSLWAD